VTKKIHDEEVKLINCINSLDERHLLELIAVKTGLKQILRIHISNNTEYDYLKKYCDTNKLLVKHSSFRLKLSWVNDIGDQFFEDIPWDDKSNEPFVAYVTKSEYDKLNLAVSVEVLENHKKAGLIYEYPVCCCENYEAIAMGEKWLDLMLTNSSGTFFNPKANKLSYLVYNQTLFPDYFPCNFSCIGTIELSTRYYDMGMKEGLKDYVKKIYAYMNRPYLVLDGNVFSFSRWRLINKQVLQLFIDSMSYYGINYLSDYPRNTIEINLPIDNTSSYWSWKKDKYRIFLFSDQYKSKD
jgi:hypothetical protein